MRCDGSPDCTDDSDEFKCDILIRDGNYNKDIISNQQKQKIDLFVDLVIRDIIHIEENDNIFRPTFELTFEWKDHRLRFQNLDVNNFKVLKEFEVQQIWKPIILLDDINQFNRQVECEHLI